METFRASCIRGFVYGCQALGADPKASAADKVKAKSALDKLCDGGDDTACIYAGRKKK